jgi:hypothetical protein
MILPTLMCFNSKIAASSARADDKPACPTFGQPHKRPMGSSHSMCFQVGLRGSATKPIVGRPGSCSSPRATVGNRTGSTRAAPHPARQFVAQPEAGAAIPPSSFTAFLPVAILSFFALRHCCGRINLGFCLHHVPSLRQAPPKHSITPTSCPRAKRTNSHHS